MKHFFGNDSRNSSRSFSLEILPSSYIILIADFVFPKKISSNVVSAVELVSHMSILSDRDSKLDFVATVMAESTDDDVTPLTNMRDGYACLTAEYEEPPQKSSKVVKIRKYQLHPKTYSPKWEKDPNYRGWVSRSKKGDGFYYCIACNQDYTCGKSELDKHASSRKHCMNVVNMAKSNSDQYSLTYTNDLNTYEVQTVKCAYDTPSLSTDYDASSSTSANWQIDYPESKEESFGKYIISELKRIKKKKTYELVKWEILQALQKAMLQEAETEDSEE